MIMNMSTEGATTLGGAAGNTARGPDRRARRRQETIAEILGIATEVMTEQGVNGLSLAEVARRLGVQPPSLYKYFPSLMAVYDALFRRGQAEHLAVMRQAMAGAEPGLAALTTGLEASGAWLLANPAIAQLMFWRPVPSFEPSPEALAPSRQGVFGMTRINRRSCPRPSASWRSVAPATIDTTRWRGVSVARISVSTAARFCGLTARRMRSPAATTWRLSVTQRRPVVCW